MKRKISVTTGSRSEYGILRPLIKKISKNHKLELYLIVAGMHLSGMYGKTIEEIKHDGFKIHSKIKMIPKKDTNYYMTLSLGEGIKNFAKIFNKIKPDINVILGDRDEMLASVIAAYHMNIPNAHIHGGDKTQGGIDEYNRHAITKMSNIHFAATQKSKQRIIKMGENPKFIFLTGSPSIDEIKEHRITSKENLEKRYKLTITGKEIILLQHSVTTQSNQSGKEILNTMKAISSLNLNTIAIAPNSDPGGREIFNHLKKFKKRFPYIYLYRTLPRSDFLGLLKYCGVLVGNSSSGMIEASYFGIPVVNIGIRQKDRERGTNVIDVSSDDPSLIRNAIRKALLKGRIPHMNNKNIFGDGNASQKIVKYLEKISLNKELIKKQISY